MRTSVVYKFTTTNIACFTVGFVDIMFAQVTQFAVVFYLTMRTSNTDHTSLFYFTMRTRFTFFAVIDQFEVFTPTTLGAVHRFTTMGAFVCNNLECFN